MSRKIEKSWIAGLVAAFMASICCILPMLAIIGGIGGSTTYFDWAEPFRPYIIALTILMFAIAWYSKLSKKPLQEDGCGCEPVSKGFFNSKGFLLAITVVSGLMVAFPYYSAHLYAKPGTFSTAGNSKKRLSVAKFSINGMSCSGCTNHIDGGLKGMGGIAISKTSFEKAITEVSYDPKIISVDSISKSIRKIGYRNIIINKH